MELCELAAVMGIMATFLCISAVYDVNGAEVPDYATVPYAILGIYAGVMQGRYITACFALLVLLLTITDWRPAVIKKIDSRIVRNAFKDEERIAEEEAKMDAEAKAFESAHGRKLRSVAAALGIQTVVVILWFSVRHFIKGAYLAGAIELVFLVFWILVEKAGMMPVKEEAAEDCGEEEVQAPLALTALGGADVIILCGVMGLYGLLSFLYAVVIVCLATLMLYMVRRIREGKKPSHGQPMVPAILMTAPLRILVALYVTPPLVRLFAWASPVWAYL